MPPPPPLSLGAPRSRSTSRNRSSGTGADLSNPNSATGVSRRPSMGSSARVAETGYLRRRPSSSSSVVMQDSAIE